MTAKTELRIPSYLDGLLEHWGVERKALNNPETLSWVVKGLDVMLAPYDLHRRQVLLQRRVPVYYAEERKRIRERDLHLDLRAILADTEADPRIGYAARVQAAAEKARPLSPTIERYRPDEAQRLLARVVWGDRRLLGELDPGSPWLSRLYVRKHVITDALAYCPDPAFRRAFIERFRAGLNDRPKRGGLPVFWAYQGMKIGYEQPGAPDAVFSTLITPDAPPPENWAMRLLQNYQGAPGLRGRIAELGARGIRGALPGPVIARGTGAPAPG